MTLSAPLFRTAPVRHGGLEQSDFWSVLMIVIWVYKVSRATSV